jgi:hypothetical protein
MNDRKLVWWLLLLLLLPLGLAIFSGDRFRYPCQDPANWDKDYCKLPLCDVTRTCPEHIFKGQRDPRLGPPDDSVKNSNKPVEAFTRDTKGSNCGK